MLVALPEITLACGTCGLLFIGLLIPRKETLISFLACLLIGITLFVIYEAPSSSGSAFNGLFKHTPLATFLKVMLLVSGGSVLLASNKTLALEGIRAYEYPVLILFSLLGMMLALSSGDFLSLFLGLELQGLCLYIITALRSSDAKTSEAGVKYFILGTLATTILLFGISLVYGFTGTTNFETLRQVFADPAPLSLGCRVGLTFMLVGLAFKIPLTPFHMWIPDVYEGTPTSITTFLAIVPKIAALGVLFCLFTGPLYPLLTQEHAILSLLAIASMIFSAFAALNQTNIKRLLGYSSIGHMGYALIGIICANQAGGQATLIYLFLYALMTLGFFICLLNLLRLGIPIETVQDLKGLSQARPGLAFAMIFLLLSMAGIPPLAGFFGKLYIFQAALSKGYIALALTGALTSVIATAYYFHLIKAVVMDAPENPLPQKRFLISPLLVSIVLTLIGFIINPSPIINWAQKAVASVM